MGNRISAIPDADGVIRVACGRDILEIEIIQRPSVVQGDSGPEPPKYSSVMQSGMGFDPTKESYIFMHKSGGAIVSGAINEIKGIIGKGRLNDLSAFSEKGIDLHSAAELSRQFASISKGTTIGFAFDLTDRSDNQDD